MGTIRKTNSGKFQADAYDASGKRKRNVFNSYAEANAYVSKIGNEKYTLKLANAGLVSNPVPLPALIDAALKEKESLAPASHKKYRRLFEVLKNFVENNNIRYVADFTREHADAYRAIITTTTAAAKTKNFYLSSIKTMFQDFADRDLILKSPFSHIKMERKKNKTMLERQNDYYTDTEIRAFFAVPMKDTYRRAFVGLFLTGCRREELISLKWDRVNLKTRIIEIRTDGSFRTKTDSSERDIPISNYLFTILSDMKRTSEYVFHSVNNSKMNGDKLLRVGEKIAMDAGITKNATLHKWRHSFTSHLEQLGVSEAVRSYLMGHKPKTMTGHYTKIDPSKLHEQISRLDYLLTNEPAE